MPIDLDQKLLKLRRTKIVATIGPASGDRFTLNRLIESGVNVFRLNMSHGDHDTHKRVCESIRQASEEQGKRIGVLVDLCGPKIRCGTFENGQIELTTGSTVVVTTRDTVGTTRLIPSQYGGLVADVKRGTRILLDDGNLELRVEFVSGTDVTCEVVQGGVLKDRKGMNLPDATVSAPSLTDKDRADARFALDLRVDFLALSFVRRASDVTDLIDLINDHGDHRPAIIAKIEKPQALDEIDEIVDAADGVMVARGDLGVEMQPETVPFIQGELITLARSKAKPVIVATQMLESMIANPRPTRAEVSDVSTAVLAGADAVMLSAETAAGSFPVKAVETMDRVARQAEAVLWKHGAFGSIITDTEATPPLPVPDAIARATAQLSRDLWVRAIFVDSRTGLTARLVSSGRPAAPVVAVSADVYAVGVMQLLWGVVPSIVRSEQLEHPEELARELVRQYGLANPGEYIVRVSGFHMDEGLNVPTVSVLTV